MSSKEIPGQDPQGESTGNIVDPAHPFGALYTKEDLHFLSVQNIKMEGPRSEVDEAITQKIYQEAKMDENRSLLDAIKEKGIMITSSSFEDSVKKIGMDTGFFEITLDQGEKRTAISFTPDQQFPFRQQRIYSLFFEELPERMFSSHDMPTPYFIKENTSVEVVTRDYGVKHYALARSAEREDFEKWLMVPKDVKDVTMSIATDRGVSYSLRVPNPEISKRLMKFSVPSRLGITPETMTLLLSNHSQTREVKELEVIENNAAVLAEAVNLVRDRFWIR